MSLRALAARELLRLARGMGWALLAIGVWVFAPGVASASPRSATGAPSSAAPRAPSAGQQAALEQAGRALAEGAPAEAERLFRRILIGSPDDPAALAGWARSLAAQGRADEAATGLLRAGERALRAGEGAAASALLADAALLAPERGELRARLGQALLLEQRHAAAEDALRAALRLGADEPATRLLLAAALWENGRLAEAEATYRQALAEAASGPVPHFQLGRFLLWQGRFAEAVGLLERALALGMDGLDVLLALARALDGARGAPEPGEPGELGSRAVAAWQALVERAPSDAYARYGLARALRAAGDLEGARRELATYRELYRRDQEQTRDAGLSTARLEGVREELRAGRPQAALEGLRDLAESAEVLETRARAELALGRRDDALRSLERAVALEPERRDLRQRLDQLRLEPPLA
ncbi:MAG TPA: tetratricopeptide repeat protein [Thermoanaerobaculia bacterium]|nr:tetratricopeptide repeat protein [Thermoanaerobaculia bacterium]